MRVSYYPDISRLARGGINGVGQAPAGAPSFWSSLGQSVLSLTNTFAPAAAQKALYGQAGQVVSTPQGLMTVQTTGTPLAGATTFSQLPAWFWPVAIVGVGAIAFIVLRKR